VRAIRLSRLVLVALALGSCTAPAPRDERSEPEQFQALVLGRTQADYTEYASRFFLKSQNLAVVCMRRQGFEYIPVEDPLIFGSSRQLPWDREYRQESGLGLARAEIEFASVRREDDPNSRIVSDLDGPNQEAYAVALFGSAEEPGCLVEAERDVAQELGLEAWLNSYSKADESVTFAPEMLKADEAFGQCLRQNGLGEAGSSYGSFVDWMAEDLSERVIPTAGVDVSIDEWLAYELATVQELDGCIQSWWDTRNGLLDAALNTSSGEGPAD
jgi:hypothetical protein